MTRLKIFLCLLFIEASRLLTDAACPTCPTGYTTIDPSDCCNACDYGSGVVSSGCVECASGYYKGTLGLTPCLSCPAGSASSSGQASCTSCTAGTYSPSSAAASCLTCPSGTTSPTGASRWVPTAFVSTTLVLSPCHSVTPLPCSFCVTWYSGPPVS